MINKKMLENYVSKNGKIKVAVAGAGYMTKGFINQVATTSAIEIVAMSSRTPQKVEKLLAKLDGHKALIVENALDLAMTDAQVIMDLTGDVELGASLAEAAIKNGKNIMVSAETDSTVGPVLAKMAREAGLVYTNMWGDEPGLIKGLYDYAQVLGLEIAVLGKFKGFHDEKANPTSVAPWAELHKQNPYALSSFADGTKLSMEMTVVSNATGFVADKRGMNLPKGEFEDVLGLLQLKEKGGILSKEGVIEVIVGPKPGGAVFILVKANNIELVESFKYYKMGDGPYYMLYIPYHMPGIEMIYGIYEMMLYNKACVEPLDRPYSDSIAIAKRNLEQGDVLDKIGGYDYSGTMASIEDSMKEDALPAGLAEDAKVLHQIKEGQVIKYSDVEIHNHETSYRLRQQYKSMLTR